MFFDPENFQIQVGDLTFVQTCGVSPEQYDVQDNLGNVVAYVRLRWGKLTARVPDSRGQIVFEHTFEGNSEYKGDFANEQERKYFLNLISNKIQESI